MSLVAVWKLKSLLGQCVLGLQLVISESSTKVFSSPVYEVKKGSPSFHIRLDQYVSLQGDIKVEFFSKPKMMRRVSYLILYTELRLLGTSYFLIQICYTAAEGKLPDTVH